MISKEILRDLEIAELKMKYFGNHQDANFRIAASYGIIPVYDEDSVLPINHSSGAFMHFRRIKDDLEKAFGWEFISEENISKKMPPPTNEIDNQWPYI